MHDTVHRRRIVAYTVARAQCALLRVIEQTVRPVECQRRSVARLGRPDPKPCRDTWNSVATWGRADSIATEKSLSQQKALRSLSRQRFPYRDKKHYKFYRDREFFVAMELLCLTCPSALGSMRALAVRMHRPDRWVVIGDTVATPTSSPVTT